VERGKGVTRDFSASVVYFETDESFSVGDAIRFAIPIEHSDLDSTFHFRCQGEVLRVESNGESKGVAVAIHSYSFGEDRTPKTP
jgi:hypothetical protein